MGRESLAFAIPLMFKSSTQTQSYFRVRLVVGLWMKSLLRLDALRYTRATRRFAFSLRWLPGFLPDKLS